MHNPVHLHAYLCRASLDRELVKQGASSIAHDLALESPELSEVMLRPPVPGGPHDLLLPAFRWVLIVCSVFFICTCSIIEFFFTSPINSVTMHVPHAWSTIFSSCRRRPYVRKQARRPAASAIAKLCVGLNNKKSKKKRRYIGLLLLNYICHAEFILQFIAPTLSCLWALHTTPFAACLLLKAQFQVW
jgi:hypothetical protein